jgi:hypothetical protein
MAFDPEQLIAELCNDYELRFREEDLAEEDIPVMVNFLARMGNVSVQLVSQEQDIKLPNTEHVIPFDDSTKARTIKMFMEGLAYALLKTAEMNVPDDARGEILQNVAQYVYENSKQVILSTFGQEHTPEFQIPEEQQISMVTQTADSALNYFIGEYEKQHGPIAGMELTEDADPMLADMDDEPADAMLDDVADDSAPAPVAEPPPAPVEQSQPPPTPQVPQALPYPLEKYAALSLLLNVLPQARGQALFSRFSRPEQDMIVRFQHPAAMMEAGLDLPIVQAQLAGLKQRFPSTATVEKPSVVEPEKVPSPPVEKPQPAYDADSVIVKSVEHVSPLTGLKHRLTPQLARQVIQSERPNIREAIDILFDDDPGKQLLSPLKSNKGLLPAAIEEIVAEHLEKLVT